MKTVTMTELMTPEEFKNNADAKNRGVYIWGYDNGKFYPIYVGKHYEDMSYRLDEHLHDLEKGVMKVIRKENLKDPEKFASKDMKDLAYEHGYFKKVLGKNYAPKSALSKDQMSKIQPHIDELKSNLKICFIAVPEELEEPSDDKPFRWVNMLERFIQDTLPGHASQLSTSCDDDFKPKINVPKQLKSIFNFNKKHSEDVKDNS